jgi:serine/threonine protein kinase
VKINLLCAECGYGVKASTKQDVYSFGVVLLEMVSGKPPVVEEDDQEFVHLTAWAARMTNEGKMDEIIDKDLRSGQII